MIARLYGNVRHSYCKWTAPTTVKKDLVKDTLQDRKILKVAIIGPPNSGKSTFINEVIGRRVCSASSKVHTTRQNIKAITVEGNTQIIFLDTPGLVTADEVNRYKLEKTFRLGAETAMLQADIIGAIHDVSNHLNRNHLDIRTLRLLHLYSNKKSFLVMNKIDLIKSKQLLLDTIPKLTAFNLKSPRNSRTENVQLSEFSLKDTLKEKQGWGKFNEVFMVSSLTGSGLNDVKEYLLDMAVPGPWLFESTQYTNMPPEEIILQTVRSRLLENLPNEIPYNLKSAMEYFDINENGCIVAVVLIASPSPRIQRMVLGHKGKTIRNIAQESEQDLRNTFHENIFLKLVVTESV